MTKNVIPVDCVIFGGGVAGLFILHRCLASGHRAVLLESKSLGTGQTIDSQGIIHGGLKYDITGHGEHSATAIKEMPLVWRRCLAGEATPDLTNVLLRSDFCHVWRTDSIRSKLGWFAAKLALRTKPKLLDQDELPEAFHEELTSGKEQHKCVQAIDEHLVTLQEDNVTHTFPTKLINKSLHMESDWQRSLFSPSIP